MTTYTAAANTTRAFCSSFSSSSRKRSIVLGRSDEKNFHRNHHPYGNKRERITRRASSSASLSSKNSEKSERKRRRRESFRGFTTTAFATKEGKFLSSSERDAAATSHRERDDVLGVFNKKNVGKPPFNVALMVMVAATAFGAFVVGGQDVAWAEMGDVAAAVAEEDLESTGGGFAQAFLLILLSELGDKTFFISLLLALKEKKSSVFLGTFGALAVMTGLSVCIGQFFHVAEGSLGLSESAIPFDDILAVLLLLYFGINTIKGAEDADDVAEEEKEEAKVEIGKMQFSGDQALILSTFALVFAAEWGDKSFFATIALSAAQDPTQVFLGGTAGHGVATGLAVLTGDLIGDYLSEKVVAYAGGALFISFAVGTLFEIFEKLS
jgi:putative Ca2+/H+ antiporter (TMEM165/GDT1 family)